MGKQFHIGDVLTITTGRLVSLRHIEGVYDILNYMTRDNLYTHQLPRAMQECKPHLLRQHPFLDSAEMQSEVSNLIAELAAPSGDGEPRPLITGWLARLAARYGETLNVEPIPQDDHDVKDPYDELVAMRGTDEGIIPIVAGAPAQSE
jgi:hypothetical protein